MIQNITVADTQFLQPWLFLNLGWNACQDLGWPNARWLPMGSGGCFFQSTRELAMRFSQKPRDSFGEMRVRSRNWSSTHQLWKAEQSGVKITGSVVSSGIQLHLYLPAEWMNLTLSVLVCTVANNIYFAYFVTKIKQDWAHKALRTVFGT